jgi:hypothetical protein
MTDHRDHPEHEFLAALPHHSLTEEERGTLLSHLAECSECRHSVMFLAETERLHKPESRRRDWRPLAIGAIAAVAIALFTSWHNTVPRSETQSGGVANILYLPATAKSRSFAHVRLTGPRDSVEADALIIHLAGFKPKGNQVVVRSQYGERWLTFDSFLSVAPNDGSVSTVN